MKTITHRLAYFAVALCVMNEWLDKVRAQPWQLWRVNADGTGLVPIADLPGYSCHSPKWSPDGTQIAFDFRYLGEGLRASQIAVIRADGSDFRVLGPGGFAGWSPDGTHCVFHTYDAPQTVTVMKADGTGRESILPRRGGPRWLSDGNHMAVMGNGNITIFDLSSGRERSISNISSPYPGFGFSRDGLRVCFGRNTGGLYFRKDSEKPKRGTSKSTRGSTTPPVDVGDFGPPMRPQFSR